MEAFSDRIRKGEEFTITIKFDGLARGVHHHLAMLAFCHVGSQVAFKIFVSVSVEKIRELFHDFFAAYQGHPRLSTLLKSSRN